MVRDISVAARDARHLPNTGLGPGWISRAALFLANMGEYRGGAAMSDAVVSFLLRRGPRRVRPSWSFRPLLKYGFIPVFPRPSELVDQCVTRSQGQHEALERPVPFVGDATHARGVDPILADETDCDDRAATCSLFTIPTRTSCLPRIVTLAYPSVRQ